MSNQPPPFQTTCHCGAITLTAPHLPAYLNECQCSLCRRYGAQWAYYKVKEDHINNAPALRLSSSGRRHANEHQDVPTRAYFWGDETATFEACRTCGCVVFWYPVDVQGGEYRMGVNARNVTDPTTLKFVEKRVTYEEAVRAVEGVYDENGPVRK